MKRATASSLSHLPRVNRLKRGFFIACAMRQIKRHFHSVRVSNAGFPSSRPGPKVIYMNHASWWDPLVAIVLKEHLFPDHQAFAPIEARQLDRYPILRNIGLLPVNPDHPTGALRLMRTARAVADSCDSMLWITPQGRFADPRERPVRLQSGLVRIAMRHPHLELIPLAIEYPFWTESRPEVLAHFADPVRVEELPADGPESVASHLTGQLQAAQDALAAESIARSDAAFHNVLEGAAGVGGVYDGWRKLIALLRGRRFTAEHGSATT